MPTISPPKRLKQSRVQCAVACTAEEVAAAEEKVLRRAAETMRLPGFRPGKAPLASVREKMGEDALMEEIVREVLPDLFETIIKEHRVKPIIPPKVELQSRTPLTLTLVFIEKPDVTVKGADKIRVKKTETTIAEKDVDRMLDYLRSQYRTVQPVDRGAREGDELVIDFAGTLEGKEAPGTTASGYAVTIGSKALIPGFEEHLVGLKKGESKRFDVMFPADYHAQTLTGKTVQFSVSVQDVREVRLPELTDDFVKSHHLGESSADLRTRVDASLKEQEKRTENIRREKELFDAIRAATVIDLAPELLAHEERRIFEEMTQNLEREKTPMDEWLKRTNRTVETLKKELTEEAGKRLTLRFAIEHLIEEKDVHASPEDIASAIETILKDVSDDQRADAEVYYREGNDGYDEVTWRKRVEKLVERMLKQ